QKIYCFKFSMIMFAKNYVTMKKYANYLLSISIVLVLVSCGGNENDDDHIYNNQMSLISLIPDRYNVPLSENAEEQEVVTFKVTNNAGEDITDQSILYVGDEQLDSNVFTPTELG